MRLAAPDAQCQAAARSSLANLIEMERGIAANSGKACLPCKSDCSAQMKDDLLALRAIEERNRAAGSALELYYRLTEAEAGLDILAESQRGVDHVLVNVAELRAQGIKIDVDEEALRRRKLELFDQQAEAELGRDQSHGGLKVLLGLADEDPTRIWPEADLKAVAEPIDVQAAVAEGLGLRAELIILRCLVESLTVQSLPGARSALSQRDASLGSSSLDMRKLHVLLAGARGEKELPGRQAQISMLLADQERAITEEIKNAAATVTTRLKQVALAKESLDGRRRHLAELERKREVGTATPFDIATEKMEITKAEGELMRRVVAWRIAQVKLKQSQGLLATECGYHHTPCCGSCGGLGCRRACKTCGPLASQGNAAPGQLHVSAARVASGGDNSKPRIVRLGQPQPGALVEQLATPPTIRRLK